MNLSPNWMSLGFVPGIVLVTTPKFELEVCPNARFGFAAEQQLVFGGANCVRFHMLKNSVRNSNPSLLSGPNIVRLNNEKSQLLTPDPRRVGSVRDSVPKTKSAGEMKQAVLNHSLSFGVPDGVDLLQPEITSGREPPEYSVVKLAFPLPKTSGKPFW